MYQRKMSLGNVFAVLLIGFFLSGCGIKDFGQTIGSSIQGDYYLNQQEYKSGLETFQLRVKENPESPTANYYYGRFLLHNNSPKTALLYLQKSSRLNPQNAEYLFWQGMAYAELKNDNSEEKLYRKALEIDKKHLQSLVYLGHNLLEKKKYRKALTYYNRAIEIDQMQLASLYNRAIILKKLNRTPEELEAWEIYLGNYPGGTKGRNAAQALNILHDYSYRNYYLGSRSVTVPKVTFKPLTALLTNEGKRTLDTIGHIVAGIDQGRLQIIAYQENNKDLARQRALAIKTYLISEFSQIPSKRIGVSWFSTPHYLKIKSKKYRLDESIDFFLSKK